MCMSVLVRLLFEGEHCHNWGQSPVHEGLLLRLCIRSYVWMLDVMFQALKANVSLLLCVLQLLLLASSLHLATPHFTTTHQKSPHLLLSLPHLTCDQHISPHLINLPSHHLTNLTSPHLTSPHLTSPHLTSPHLTSCHQSSPYSPHYTSTYFIPTTLASSGCFFLFSSGLAQVQWLLKHVKTNRPELLHGHTPDELRSSHLVFQCRLARMLLAKLVPPHLVPFCPTTFPGASNLQQCDSCQRASSIFFFLQGICSGNCMTC